MTVETRRWQPEWSVPPGEILAEALEERAMSQAELARRLDRPIKTVNEIIRGKASITADTAVQLEQVLDVPARFWLNLQRDHSEAIARRRADQQRDEHASWIEAFPIAAMRRQKLLPQTRVKSAVLEALLRFFGVTGPEAWRRQQTAVQATFRRSTAFEQNAESVAVWLRLGELKASPIATRPFNAQALRALIPQLRSLSRTDPSVFSVKLVEMLADVGVVIAFVRELPGTRVMGATRWLSPERALLQLSLRYRRDDQFWFALFHELGHLLEGSRRRSYIEVEDTADADESAADQFASRELLPESAYGDFTTAGDFSEHAVREFARNVDVAPGIVVGRLQHDRHVPFARLNYLKTRIDWSA
ncbi:MAG: HigA family addiction module antitoxin [Chloroflexota bacterium]